MFEAPLTFAEAEKMLSKRLDTPTALKHHQIAAMWDADFRQRAFFSARVAEATILSELHNRVQAVVDGRMTDQQAVGLLRDYFVGPGADPLAKLGFAPQADARTITELASYPRLELIIETNVRMAQECGHYQQWAESAAYYRYGVWRCGYSKEHRPEHLARNGRVYPFDHPIWTQSPPGGEFNCHCYREVASEEDIQELGLTPEPLHSPFEPSSLGFDPSRSMAEPPPFGRRVRPEYAERAQERINRFAAGEEPMPPLPTPAAPLTPEQHAAKREAQWQQAYEKRVNTFEAEIIADAEQKIDKIEKLFLPAEQRVYTDVEKEEAKQKAQDKIKEIAAEFKSFYTPEFAKLAKPPKVVLEPTQLNGTWYRRSTNTVNVQLKDRDTNRFKEWNASLFAIRHEMSHWLHYEKGGATDDAVMSQIRTAGRADWKEIREALNNKEGIFSSGFLPYDLNRYVTGKGNHDPRSAREHEVYQALADSIGSISNGIEGWGHKKIYYKDQNKRLPFGEAVANIYALSLSIPEEKIKLVFPKLFDIVMKWR